MEISYLYNKNIFNQERYSCFALKLSRSKDIWLFNCSEGCQNYCTQAQIKISQISKIIITELKINNISGLIGLLSSLSLINRKKNICIYGPLGIEKYLYLIKKYSKTNFKYNLYVFILQTGILINIKTSLIYLYINFIKKQSYEFIIINNEKQYQFNLIKAKAFQVLSGPLYGELKKCFNFVLPDGLILNGYKFIKINEIGKKLALTSFKYHTRQFKQANNQSNFCYFI